MNSAVFRRFVLVDLFFDDDLDACSPALVAASSLPSESLPSVTKSVTSFLDL
jgi:hypothetical protein